jgi:hypothetical protein
MLDLLSDFLASQTSAEEKAMLQAADDVLQRAEIEYEHILEEILMTAEELDSGAPLLEIRNVYQRGLNYLLALHAVTLVDAATLPQKTEIVAGLLTIDNTENPQQFFKIADEEMRANEKLAEILSRVMTWSADQLLQLIDDVSDTFFLRLKDSHRAELEQEDDGELHERRERIHAYRLFEIYLQALGANIIQVPSLLAQGIQPGMTYELYAKLIDGRQPILTMPGYQIARELFAAALISRDGYGNPGETVKASLEQFIPDLKLISDTMIEVRQLMTGYAK